MQFSILIPVYNAERYLKDCLDSIFAQDMADFEVIMVDDGSTDNSYRICREYADKDSRFKSFHQNNCGPFATRRECAGLSRGEYLVFVDSDDIVSHKLLSVIDKAISENNCDYLFYNSAEFIDDTDNLRVEYKSAKSGRIDRKELYEKILDGKISNGVCGKVFKRSLFDFENTYDNQSRLVMGEDLLQNLPIITKASNVYYLDEVLYFYRQYQGSLTHSFKPEYVKSLMVLNEYLAYYASKWNIGGEKRIAVRYLYDVYDMVRYTYNDRRIKVINSLLSTLYAEDNIKYYREQYVFAEKRGRDIQFRMVSFFIYCKLRVPIIAYIKIILPFAHRIKELANK